VAIGWALLGIVIGSPPWGRWLAAKPLRWIGRRAYAVYLVHVACIWLVEIFLRPGSGSPLRLTAIYVLSAAVSLAFAEVLYRIVERPLMLAGKRISARMLAGAEPPPTAPEAQPAAG
jgi:peptidoglycan/LPS O-acetylase OafA/YrhL